LVTVIYSIFGIS